MAGGNGPRYAPEDPSLPHPWRALVDGSTGYIYYWNTESNITQYDKPHAHPPLPSGSLPAAAPAPKLASEAVRASPGTNADAQTARHAERRHFDSGSHAREGAGIADSSQHSGSHGMGSSSHHSSSHGNRFAPSDPSVAAPGNVYIHSGIHTSGHHSGHIASGRTPTHPGGGGHMPSSGTSTHHSTGQMSGSFASRSQPAMPGGASRSGPDMPGSGMVSAGSRSGGPGISSGNPRSGAVVPGAAVRMNARDRPWESSINRDGPWGSGGGSKDGSWGSSGKDSQWGSIKQTYGSSSSSASIRGGPGGNMHGSTRNTQDDPRGLTSLQPRVATIPMQQRQQTLEGYNPAVQSRQMGEPHLSVAGGRSYLPSAPQEASHKRSASDFVSGGPDLLKRPRLQGFSEPPHIMDVDGYRRQHEVTVVGTNVPPPLMTFESANFPPEISRELLSAGFAAPTPIQAQSWPIALQGHDVVAIAKTGSGKTLGYLLPGFLHILRTRANAQSGPLVLVLAPTRELATQIHEEAVKFGRSSRISSTCVYGGAPKGQQLRELERGTDIVIATPGRLNDFLEMKKVSLRQVSYLVLDEADRMLDMGFEPQIRKIVKEVPLRRQTLMFTATWPREVRKIAGDLLTNPVHVTIGNCDELTANKAITQYVEMVQPYEKQRRLEQILRSQEPGSKTIIFCSTKKMCEQLARGLGRGFGAAAIHGDKTQGERDHVLAQFKAGRSPILVATDVAARGLDVKDIRVVINYDFPTGVEDYVHRIGRTGRAGATGMAFTFFSEQDSKYAKELIKILEGSNQAVPVPLREIASRSFQARGRGVRWGSGSGAEPRDASMGSRGIGGRDVRDGGWGSKDEGGMRVGSLGNRGGGFVGRDASIHSRIGAAGGRAGAIEEKDGGFGSRVGVTGGRGGGFSGRGGGSMGRASGAPTDGWDAAGSGGWGGTGRDDVGGHGDVWGRLGGSEQWPGGRQDGNGIGGGRGGLAYARSKPMGSRDAGGFNKGHSKEQEDTFRQNDGCGAGERGDGGPKETLKGDDDGWEDAAAGWGLASSRGPSGFTDKQPDQEERGRGQDDPKRPVLREKKQSKQGGGDWSPTIKRRGANSPASGGWSGRSRSPSKGLASGSGSHSRSRSRSPYGKSRKVDEGGWSPPPGKGTGRSRSLSPKSTTASGYPNVGYECSLSGQTTAEGGMLDIPLLDQSLKESKLGTPIDSSNQSTSVHGYHLANNATPLVADRRGEGASEEGHLPTAGDDLGIETPVEDEGQSHLTDGQQSQIAAFDVADDGAMGVSDHPSDEGVERDLEDGFEGDL